jgi:oligopeptidase B
VKKSFVALCALILSAAACATSSPAPSSDAAKPPVARKERFTQTVHGDTLADDYHWLRKKGDPEVEGYLKAENDYTAAVMRPTEPLQQALYQELLGHIKETDLSVPSLRDGWYHYSRTEAGKQYPIMCRKKGTLQAPEEITLDLNAMAVGKTFISLGMYGISDDGNLLAYSTDETGFRQFTLEFKDLRTGKNTGEKIPRAGSVIWAKDNKTVLYTVDDPVSKRSHRAYRHVVGQEPKTDVLVFEEKDERFDVALDRSRDRVFWFLGSTSHTQSEWKYLSTADPAGTFKLIEPRSTDLEYDVEHFEGRFVIRANDKGRNFRLVTAPVATPGRSQWKELRAHRDDVFLNGVDVFRSHYVVSTLREGLPRLEIVDWKSGAIQDLTFPEPVYSAFVDSNPEYTTEVLRFSYQSPVTPPSVFDHDLKTRQRQLLKQQEVPHYDASQYAVERLWAPAADGVKIPVTVVHRKAVKNDGKAPLFLSAYGSYGASIPDYFNSSLLPLLDRGAVAAFAHIRGGGELGKKWHDEGRMMKKKNTFTDFISSAEFLAAQGWGARDRIVVEGGSAGGLLMGAVTNLRPDLWKAVIAAVPFVDVMNTMLDESLPLTVSEFEEWGNPKVKADYDYMLTYSPYDNLVAKPYPTILVKSSYNDSQVMYWEPAKYVAKLRSVKTDANPLLLKMNMDPAGHGGKSGRYDRLRETAFDWAFVLWQMGLAGASPTVANR